MNQTAAKALARYPNKISEIYRDSDGWWINLKPGWMSSRGSFSRTIHEAKIREAVACLRNVVEWPDDPEVVGPIACKNCGRDVWAYGFDICDFCLMGCPR